MDFLLFCFDRSRRKHYYAPFMSARAVIDSLEFARSGRHLRGTVPVAELARLADSLYDAGGELTLHLNGGFDDRQRPRLQLAVAGSLNLKCQRCLGSFAYAVAVQSNLLVLTGQAGGETAGFEDLDGIPADAHTDVWSVVEDEILLAIPLSPRHAEAQCSQAVKAAADRAESPFAVLAKLTQERIRN
mgnify:CR=1 FL=1